ncbi:hypothetical protein GCM10008956_04610 [Deinococcus arenae]|uniref:Uncharacterized protein n=2 Tax=Deinococcus arenae TaxID=1452751 RepID=A0A8H9L5H7_9DEIO|nr:hypothetical protein DM785_09795 [Deinococcus actinosclerus]GGM31542.1 hypothetical protein GCM10008956_04610 [Deinococcus arenae]
MLGTVAAIAALFALGGALGWPTPSVLGGAVALLLLGVVLAVTRLRRRADRPAGSPGRLPGR